MLKGKDHKNALEICLKVYIYVFIGIALDETSILVALHFSMQNIYQSCDLGQSNSNVSQ